MENGIRRIALGFTTQQFEPGIHICQIFNGEEERHDTLINYIISGLQEGENTACFSENENETSISEFFNKNGIEFNEVKKSGNFLLSKTAEVYFEGEKFEPERMLKLLQEFYENAVRLNRSGARVIGEMSPEIEHTSGGSRLLEYESKVSLLLKKYPINAVCQYDASSFDGSTIMDIIKVHPYMLVKGSVVHNPFYIQPEEYLSSLNNKKDKA
jgi:hypothetical protein